MSCCHYDEGYDEGYEAGKDERGYERSDVVETLRLLSRERVLAGDFDGADVVTALADEIERDEYIANRVTNERDRIADLRKLYMTARVAA